MREMKDSGIEWVREIPVNWVTKKAKYMFVQRNTRGNSTELQLLSPTQEFGVIPQSLFEELTTNTAVKINEKTDLMTFKTVHSGDYCISLRSFQGGFEYSVYEGVVSPVYTVFYPVIPIIDGYYKYIFKDQCFIREMNSFTLSLRDGKNISFDDFGNSYLPCPTMQEQQAIAVYLDTKCAEIDSLVADIQSQIEALEEYKKSLVFQVVSRGIGHTDLKETGSDVWTSIPNNWKLTDIKYMFEIIKRIAGQEGFDVLSVTQKGLRIKDIESNNGQLAESYAGYQFVYPTDYVMNHMDLLTGWWIVQLCLELQALTTVYTACLTKRITI